MTEGGSAREGNAKQEIPAPFTLVIFGSTGDLTARKIMPAIYQLFRRKFLPEKFHVIGFGRRALTDDAFAEMMQKAIREFGAGQGDAESWRKFKPLIQYHRGDFDSAEGFVSLRARLEKIAKDDSTAGNVLFYLATPPDSFGIVAQRLAEGGLAKRPAEGAWSRLVVEKPFGHDLDSARKLNKLLHDTFGEDRIFRIDHYLGKEAVQNILVFRFANSIFEPLWDQKYIDHVQITISEEIGVEKRGAYYDRMGALRDMVQNHMMHLLCFVAMESPTDISANAVRNEKVKVLRSMRAIPRDCAASGVARAQYAGGGVHGSRMPAYIEEAGVAPDSTTETYVAFKAYIDNWRWAGVPFYLRTGKALKARMTKISIYFKPVPQILFNSDSEQPLPPNVLVLRIQPDEGISLQFMQKVPGEAMNIKPFEMNFGYGKAFGKAPPEAYERLLLDAALGDTTLFIRNDELEAAWAYVEPIIEGCGAARQKLPTYPAGSEGPREADELIRADGRRWEPLTMDAEDAASEEPHCARGEQ